MDDGKYSVELQGTDAAAAAAAPGPVPTIEMDQIQSIESSELVMLYIKTKLDEVKLPKEDRSRPYSLIEMRQWEPNVTTMLDKFYPATAPAVTALQARIQDMSERSIEGVRSLNGMKKKVVSAFLAMILAATLSGITLYDPPDGDGQMTLISEIGKIFVGFFLISQ
jgi:hypothetical protein